MDTIEIPQETGPNESASNTEKIISNEKTISVISSPEEKNSEGIIQASKSRTALVSSGSSDSLNSLASSSSDSSDSSSSLASNASGQDASSDSK